MNPALVAFKNKHFSQMYEYVENLFKSIHVKKVKMLVQIYTQLNVA